MNGSFRCDWGQSTDISILLEELIKKLSDNLEGFQTELSPHDCVHDIRVTIRKIRALCWLMDHSDQDLDHSSIRLFEKKLKDLFKKFEKARELYILSKALKKQKSNPLDKEDLERVEKKLDKTIQKVKRQLENFVLEEDLKEEMRGFSDQVEGFYIEHQSLTYVVEPYIERLKSSKVEAVEGLHKLRIEGKRLKYLYSMGCIVFDDALYKQILKLHDAIGDYHDMEVNMVWVKKLSLNKTLISLLEVEKKSQLETINPLLLQLKIQIKIIL